MTTEISDKNWVMLLIGGDRHFLNEAEAEAVKKAIAQGDKYIDLEDIFFNVNQFAKLIKRSEYQTAGVTIIS